ncbi:MAG: type II secretion system protein M [Magnetococcales bacterium]|nr:type II secretion system protein M [Magnetococcales bacterium]
MMRGMGWIDGLSRRWAAMGRREQRVVIGGGIVLLVVLGQVAVVEPGLAWLEQRRRQLEEKNATLAWMQRSAQEMARLRSAGVAAAASRAPSGESLLALADRTAQEMARLRSAGVAAAASRAPSGESLLALADRTAKEKGLGGALRRVEPDGAGRVRMWFEKAPFAGVMAWLSELEGQRSVRVENLVVDREEQPGQVRVRLVLLGAEAGTGAARGLER